MAALLAAACLLLVACTDPASGATSLTSAPPAASSPQATPAPSDTPVLPTPTPTAEPSPTALPSPAVSPTPSPTLPPSPTATPTQARSAAGSSRLAVPDAQLEAARRYQVNGDYAEAIAAYQAILDGQPAAEQVGQARYHLAECLLLAEDYAGSAGAWESFIAASDGDPLLPQAHLMAGRAYRALGECRQARPHLEAYLAGDGTLADMVYEWLADCDAEQGAWDEAIAAYRKALAAAGDRSTEVGLREKVAGVYLAQNRVAPAVAEYDAILAVARQAPYRAKIEYLAGKALAADGQIEAAQNRYRRAVDKYPQAESAYLALVELVDAEAPVDEFQRGLVDYYAGAAYPDAYGAAIRAFDRYLELKPAPKADEALHRKALAQRALGQTAEALETLDRVMIEYPRSTWQAAASFETAATLAEAGEEDLAVKAYLDMAGFFPADKQAPEALWRAARLRDRAGAFSEAAALYERLQSDLPGSDQAEEALWRAGLAHYRAGSRQSAVGDWQALLAKYPTSGFRLPSLYWLGKLGIKPKDAGQPGYWDQLVRSYPRNFYALRAKQMRSGGSLTSARMVVEPIQSLPWDEAQAEADLLHWLRGWTAVPTDTHLVDLPARLAQRSDVKKGQALLTVGLRREALAAFDSVRSAAWNDPVALAQLAFSFRQQGLYGLSARCAARLAGLWPKGLVEDAPLALQQLAYPLAYTDLLSAEALAQELDPLLLAAVIRQESLFEPTAESYAGARGLGQVMPATGEGIAQSLGMDDFELDDLYRPSVSIRFAAFYLGVQLGRFDEQILVALAAYNGGPGNTLRWLEAGGDDLDLFVETITAEQSRHYLQRVYEQYLLYEELAR